jgi:hypothetical protein
MTNTTNEIDTDGTDHTNHDDDHNGAAGTGDAREVDLARRTRTGVEISRRFFDPRRHGSCDADQNGGKISRRFFDPRRDRPAAVDVTVTTLAAGDTRNPAGDTGETGRTRRTDTSAQPHGTAHADGEGRPSGTGWKTRIFLGRLPSRLCPRQNTSEKHTRERPTRRSNNPRTNSHTLKCVCVCCGVTNSLRSDRVKMERNEFVTASVGGGVS